MTDFVTCPFCAGHEKVSDGAAAEIADWLAVWEYKADSPLKTELLNIRNAILNTAERKAPVKEYTPPECPTPSKRIYYTALAAADRAAEWKQHAYLCACGYWHLSKQSPAEHGGKINAPAASADEFDAIPIDPLLL